MVDYLKYKAFHHVAVGIIVDNNQRILISKRPSHKLKGGFWEFPGGKIEKGETPELALVRELQEEIGILAVEYTKLIQYRYAYEEHTALLEVFIVNRFEGEPKALEGQEIQWITTSEFSNYQFLEANIEMINAFLLKVPLGSDI